MAFSDKDRVTYEALVDSCAAPLYRFAYRLCGSGDRADDLLQETFLEAWRSIRTLRDSSRGKAWLFQILRRCYGRSVQKETRKVPAFSDNHVDEYISIGETDALTKIANRELLQKALDDIDDACKVPFLLVFLEGYLCREAAEMLDLPLGTVLSRIHRARVLLRERLHELDGTEREMVKVEKD